MFKSLWKSRDPSETVFIRTDQLDGETDWKLREPVKITQKIVRENQDLLKCNGFVQADKPIVNIYEFIGVFYAYLNGEFFKEPLRLNNTMWADTVLASGEAFGMVVYTGKESRRTMNSKTPQEKVGLCDFEINLQGKLLFWIMLVATVVMQTLKGYSYSDWYISMFRYFILLCCIIPISLRVNLDLAKLLYSIRINGDNDIEGTIARNSNIPEELGRIQFLLTDKTGTLTQNMMKFKKVSLERDSFTEESLESLSSILERLKDAVPGADLAACTEALANKTRMIRNRDHMVLDMVALILLCNNVTPVIESNGHRALQASSPDEIALVDFAEGLGTKIISRTQKEIQAQIVGGEPITFEILANFPFSSESKRMGILLREKASGRITFYLKGADTVMAKKVPSLKGDFLLEECDMMAKEGLRTLAFGQKHISNKFYEEWKKIYEDACADMDKREAREREAIDFLEQDLEFVGCTGVEDKLQVNVRETVESLRKAGIRIWMLTGDKIETAKCIAVSTGIKDISQKFYEIKEIEDEMDAKIKLEEFERHDPCGSVLIVDGTTLKTFFKSPMLCEAFIKTASLAPATICSRCAPTQKADVTSAIRRIIKQVTCGVGDGGNDVGMIQMAHVGIGIEGKEGKQASLAADFSVRQFKNIYKLILWHGRLSYLRTGILSNFVVHRGMIISVIQFIFQCLFYYVSISIYNGNLILGYTTLYTMFPVFSMVYTSDVTKEQCLAYPELYRPLQQGRILGLSKFCIWTWVSIYQGFVLVFFAVAWFSQNFTELATVTFTALIIMEILNVMTTVPHFLEIIRKILDDWSR